MSDILHYGTPRHSGRYPWGSGDDPEQRGTSFLGQVDDLRKKGLSDIQIAKGMGLKNTTELRNKRTIAIAEERKANVAQAIRLKEKGYSNVEIGKRMGGVNESTVRSWLDPSIQQRSEITNTTANMLKDSVENKKYIDVGVGVERYIGVSRTKLKAAISQLEEDGYRIHKFSVDQVGTGKKTNMMVLTKNDVEYPEIIKNKDKIKMITDHSEDGGRTFLGLEPIKNIDSNRIHVRYAEDGGVERDGVIELRRGVEDISLGNSKYAQVRIGVDGKHYLKGMAMYSDNLPDGVDIVFNTNKKRNDNKLAAMKVMAPDMNDPKAKSIQALSISKEQKEDLLKKGVMDGSITPDPDNPFGATIKAGGQRHYTDAKGKSKLSVVNIVNEEGDWAKWNKAISSQVLSKQTPALARKQLGLSYDTKKQEFDEIMSLTNPAVKKFLLSGSNGLTGFAADCDSAAVHLKSASLPRQGSHVLLPFPSMKESEIYAPNYRDGEQVVLIRYPHGGIFEIPQLTVNNKNKEAKSALSDNQGHAKDAVGINSKVAERLSGADFDGDTVLVIPNPKGEVKTSSPLKGLINFDPKVSYPAYEGMPKISPRTKQMKMGDVSNLITDMTIKGANPDEIAAAVRHSMVVIDSEKHNLNYRQSYIDNGIGALKKKYQGSERSGASTLISKASSEKRVYSRKEKIDPKTGKKIYEYTNESYTNGKGEKVLRTISSTKMAEEDNAFALSSGTPMEAIYATHANKLKALGNAARKEAINTMYIPYSPSAKKVFDKEVSSLKAKLNIALKNAPLERQAQLLANSVVAAKKSNNPGMEADELKKIKGQALAEARTRVGAKKVPVEISDREWEAIQAGAISTNTLNQILNNTDIDRIKQLATPRTSKVMTTLNQQRAKAMLANGKTQAEVADALGVSTNAIAKLIE